MTLPKHAIAKSGDGALSKRSSTPTPADQTDVHRQLAKRYPGAGVATSATGRSQSPGSSRPAHARRASHACSATQVRPVQDAHR
jgi:hypothetical protein